jgi:hypothetical protein
MKKILLHAESYDSFWAHYSLINDKFFHDEFRKLGFQLYKTNECEPEDADFIIFLEAKTIVSNLFIFQLLDFRKKIKFLAKFFFAKHPKRPILRKIISNGENKFFNNSYLLILEGILDAPENHSVKLSTYVKKVFTWNDSLVDNSNFIKILVPQQIEWPNVDSIPFSKKKLVVNISSNKFSNNLLELYSERRGLIKYLDKYHSDQFDLYGFGWNQPSNFLQKMAPFFCKKYTTYRVIADDKAQIFSKYKFGIVYENASVPGYVTEKIFDCLRSNCIPIYLGAPNIAELVPSNLFIDRRNFNSNRELLDFLLNIDEDEYLSYIMRIKKYLLTDNFRSHLSISLAHTIALNL